MTNFLKHLLITIIISLISLAIATNAFNEDQAKYGVIFWFVFSLIYPSIKVFPQLAKWDRQAAEWKEKNSFAALRKRAEENLASLELEQAELRSKIDYAQNEPLDTAHEEDNSQDDFKPWTDEDLIWKGKRKLTIEYYTTEGVVTQKIDLLGIWPNEYTGEIQFRAYCHDEEDWSTFDENDILTVCTARNKKFESFHDFMSNELGI